MTVTTPGGSSKDGSNQREKYWSELTDTERIERMRQMVRSLQYSLNYASREFRFFKKKFFKHQHTTDGKMVRLIEEYDEDNSSLEGLGGIGNSRNTDNENEVFF